MTELDDRPASRSRSRRRALWITVALVAAAGLVVGLALFQPWKIFTRSTVNEAAPAAAASVIAPTVATPSVQSSTVVPSPVGASVAAPPKAPASSAGAGADAGAPRATSLPATTPPAPPSAPTVLATGTFLDGEHATTGTVSVLQLPDGSRYVRLEGFSTSDGPDVQVWVTDRRAGGDDWGKYDDGRYVELGTLKGTDGNQNYAVPADADLTGLTSVVIWCDRFNVAFGSAPIDL